MKVRKGYLIVTFVMLLGSLFFSPCMAETFKVWVDGAGKVPYASDALLLPASFFGSAVFGHGLELTEGRELKPSFIESWSWDFKEKFYTIKLRSNLKFHNGREATAADLEFSILRGLFTPSKNFALAQFADVEGVMTSLPKTFTSGAVSGVKIISKYELRIKLKDYNPQFLHFLTYSYYSLVPREELESDYFTWKRNPVGVGDYKVLSIDKDHKKVFLKSVRPSPIDLLEFQYGGAPEGADLILGSNLDRFKSIDSSLYIKELNRSYNMLSVLCFNSENPLAQKKEFRESVSSLINREALSKELPASLPAYEFLPERYWGRLGAKPIEFTEREQVPNVGIQKFVVPIVGAAFPQAFLDELNSEFSKAKVHLTFRTGGKFRNSHSKSSPIVLISIVQDTLDPLEDLGMFRPTSPMATFRLNADALEKVFAEVGESRNPEERSDRVKNISKYVLENFIAVPIAFRYSEILEKKSSVLGLGSQNGGVEFYLDRLVLNPNRARRSSEEK